MTAEPTQTSDGERLRPFVFDVAAIPGHTNADLLGDEPGAEEYLELLGRDLVTKALVQTAKLCVYHAAAKPGERVKPHRHGTYQVNYVLRGELIFGNQRVTAGMGYSRPTCCTRGGRVTRAPNGSRSTRASAGSSPTDHDFRRPARPPPSGDSPAPDD